MVTISATLTIAPDLLSRLADRCIRRHPDLAARVNRAVDIVLHGEVQAVGHDGQAWIVRSPDAAEWRIVRPHESSCTCPDAISCRALFCKHQLAVGLILAAQAEPPMPPAPVRIDQALLTGRRRSA